MVWFANPFQHVLFPPVAVAVGSILSALFLYALWMEHGRGFFRSSLFQKWASSVCLAPVAVLSILSGIATLTVLATAAAIIGTLELAKVTSLRKELTSVAVASGLVLVVGSAFSLHVSQFALVIALLPMATISVITYREKPSNAVSANVQALKETALAVLLVLYTPFLVSHAILIGRMESGAGLLLTLVAAVALSDTMAFVCGKLFGRHKLAPYVSPNKSWEGFVGNIIGAYAGFLIMRFACPDLPIAAIIILPSIIAIASVIGDLWESLIKRSCGVKDVGTWLPGFGGLLDRIDALLFALPVTYLFLAVIA